MTEDPYDERIVEDIADTMTAYEADKEDEANAAIAKEYESLVKKMEPSFLKDNIKMGFCDIKHSTAKAILFETYKPLTGETYEQWLPKGVCSNLCWEGKFVYVWNKFAEEQLEDWYEEPLP